MAVENEREVICEYKGSVNQVEPVNHRRYTFLPKEDVDKLVVGLRFDSRNTDSNRNEILGQWAISDDRYVLYFHINIEFDENAQSVAVRDSIIRSTLAKSIKKILKADIKLLEFKEDLFKSPVIVYFKCTLPYYNRVENWGTVEEYLSDKDLKVLQYSRKEVDIIKLLIQEHIEKKIFDFYKDDEDYKMGNLEFCNIDSNEVLRIYCIDFIVDVLIKEKIQKFKGTIKISQEVFDIIQFEVE
ncbi:MAG: staygreen family protein [Sarcina sp.]